jgi:hypothetical protein
MTRTPPPCWPRPTRSTPRFAATAPAIRTSGPTRDHWYQTYERDDRRIRSLAAAGDLRAAIAFCTSYQPGASNYAFTQYDQALTAVTAINQTAFDQAISAGNHELDGWYLKLAIGAAAVALLTFLGVRRRLAEYR